MIYGKINFWELLLLLEAAYIIIFPSFLYFQIKRFIVDKTKKNNVTKFAIIAFLTVGIFICIIHYIKLGYFS